MTSSGGSANGPVLNLGIIGLGGGASQMLPAFAPHSPVRVTAAADIDQGAVIWRYHIAQLRRIGQMPAPQVAQRSL